MDGTQGHQFRTKTGTCTITPRQIILERQGVRGGVAQTVYGNSIQRALVVNTIIGLAALALGVRQYLLGGTVIGAVYCVVGLIFLWDAFASRNNSAASVIERSTVESIETHPPRPPFTRAYFSVWFMEDGRKRRRMIMLPGSSSGGHAEYEKALAIMRETGLLK